MGFVLVCNNAAICGGRMDLKIIVRYLSEWWKSLDSESVMMFLVPLICLEYRVTSLLTRFHHSHQANVSCGSSVTDFNEYLCIHPRAIELSRKARMCYPYPNCCMFM